MRYRETVWGATTLVVLAASTLVTGCGSGGAEAAEAERGASGPGRPADLGINTNLNDQLMFPKSNAWNQDISTRAVDPDSDAYIARLVVLSGAGTPFYNRIHPDFGQGYGMPYVVVGRNQPKVPVTFQYDDESDPGPYPIPPDAPVEGGVDPEGDEPGDRHVIVLNRDQGILYEMFDSHRNPDGSWRAGSGAIFRLTRNDLRPLYWTSADAAGLAILPGLVRHEEAVVKGEIRHAVRFTAARTRRAFVAPARHWASNYTDADLLPMGARLRLKASFVIPTTWPAEVQAICRGLQRYGMMLADNGGTGFITGAQHEGWDNDRLAFLKQVHLTDFEVVELGTITDH